MTKSTKTIFRQISLNLIDVPTQADRISIDPVTVRELALSIQNQGLLQPIVLNQNSERFDIIAGHRRFLAVQSLGLDKIDARVVQFSEADVSLARATENLQRENLSPVEEAKIYARMINDLKLTYEQIAEKTGRSPGTVRRRMDVIRMPESFQAALHNKKVSLTVAEELWSCPDNDYREYLLEMACDHGITQAVARQWVADYKKSQRNSPGGNDTGGSLQSVAENQPIYRSCDLCAGPVDLAKVQELRICPTCYKQFLKIMSEVE